MAKPADDGPSASLELPADPRTEREQAAANRGVLDRLLWRNHRNITKSLRIAVTLDAPEASAPVSEWLVPAWLADTVSLLASDANLALAAIVRIHSTHHLSQAHGLTLFDWLDRKSRAFVDPCAPGRDLRRLLPSDFSVPWIELTSKANGGHDNLDANARSQLADLNLDILIRLDRVPLAGDAAGLAKLGVWSLRLGAASDDLSLPPYWRAVRDETPSTTLGIEAHSSRWESGHVFYQYSCPTRQGLLFTENSVEPLSMAGVCLLDRLLAVASQGYDSITGPGEKVAPRAVSRRSPGPLETGSFLIRKILRDRREKQRTAAGLRERWCVHLRNNKALFAAATAAFDASGFRKIPDLPGSDMGDPFVVHWQGRDYLLVEEMVLPERKGRITGMEIASSGAVGPPVVILDTPYHLSYPCLVQHAGDLFMVPESSEAGTVQLYRARSSPLDWEFVKNLFEGATLVDTTPFFHEGLWYFFTAQLDRGLRTLLFYSKSLDGEWMYHPRNPISSDVCCARPAGALFWRNGKLIRPAQDGSLRYGYATVLNEVHKLSPLEYEERPIERIEPLRFGSQYVGVHTLNASERWEAIDTVEWSQ